MSVANARRSRVVLRGGAASDGGAAAGMSAADRATLTRLLLERGLEVSCSHEPIPTSRSVAPGAGAAASPDAPCGIRIVDLTDAGTGERSDLATLAAVIERGAGSQAGEPATDAPPAGKATPWKPWFPVIDYSRCTNCMQCLSFCLFEVYGVSADSKIQVQHQSNCKTDCPACSRVCPEVAIMFPKYRHGPINGEEVTADDIRREAMKVDISALLGGDVYAMLRDRSVKAKSRFSKERDDDRALKERQNCLIALQRDLDVPAEVFAALPSPQEIMAKAEAARIRAQAAIQATTVANAGQTVDPSAPSPESPVPGRMS
jgi:NAD-dependent dihydropyrimidine dehydrogenase PreA subunit